MTEQNKAYKEFILSRKHHAFRTDAMPDKSLFTTGKYHVRMKNRLRALLDMQTPVFIPGEMFVPTRTTTADPDILTENDPEIKAPPKQHERGWLSNICPSYSNVIEKGLFDIISTIRHSAQEAVDPEKKEYAATLIETAEAIIAFADRYKKAALEAGEKSIYKSLDAVAYGARSFREALQAFRILHFCLWLEGDYHVTVGRFDQYMYPYYKRDIEKGVLTRDKALEMLENLFITFNKDSDLYIGVQQGDNGQSMMLGGTDIAGNDEYNELSELCLQASLNVQMIDPKINLRVNKNTPIERLIFASHLTATGMGFPQYSNDDVVIPGLEALGYDKYDAVNYTVAACWEFIIPGCGMEIPNVGWLSFPDCVNTVIRRDLDRCEDFASFLICVDNEINDRCKAYPDKYSGLFCRPAPLMSILMDDCIYSLSDVTNGAKYNNFGIHGVGVATAADSIAAVEALVFNGFLTPKELIDALDKDFEGYEALRNKILNTLPHMGNNDDRADCFGIMLLDSFARALAPLKNDRGGRFRAGTGTALFYAAGRETGATADGRRKDDYLPANFTPSLNVRLNGPLSVIASFTKPDLTKTINGGPLTLELASSSVRDEEGIVKTAYLVKKFIDLGGHQIQLNVVSREKLMDAQKNPEKYKNLVVRVWGWSGYFTELDKIYQDQILARTEHTV
ncbi:MAG: pyruvate formate-lyase [Ruminococcaceae bacterium]|nr:pyruvate formate-lyase [Oscillospiraceae bacterium]